MIDREPAEPSVEHVTMLLQAVARGEGTSSERGGASAELLRVVYGELRKLAASNMQRERNMGVHNTLEPTALVHEAYLRLIKGDGQSQEWNSRGHFFGAAAQAMRRILVERARARGADKRGGGRARAELREDAVACDPTHGADADERSVELLALDRALDKLKELDERAVRVVMLRYFAGLSIEQTAAALSTSPATVKKAWTFARAWLSHEMRNEAAE